MVLLNFIMLKYTIAIVIVRYKYLREKLQLENEIKATIINRNAKKMRERWINLLLFRKPRLLEGNSSAEEENNIREERGQYTFGTIFKLNWYNIKKGLPLQSRDEKEAEYKEIKEEIIKAKIQRRKDIIHKFSIENFNQHKKDLSMVLLHTSYWVLFILIVILQMNIGNTFGQSQISHILTSEVVTGVIAQNRVGNATGSRPNDTFFDFYEIVNAPEVFDWVGYISDTYLIKEGATLNHNNHIFGSPRAKVSVRRLKPQENKNELTNEVILTKITGKDYDIDSSLGSSEYTEDISLKLGGELSHVAGGGDTPRKQGGYIMEIPVGMTIIYEELFSLYQSDILSKEWVFITLEFLYHNPINEYTVLNQAVFK